MLTDTPLLQAIEDQTTDSEDYLRRCLVMGYMLEGGTATGPWKPGDGGRSRGPYQIKTWIEDDPNWRGHPLSIEEAEDPATAVAYALKYAWDPVHQVMAGLNYRGLAQQYSNPVDVVFSAERPATYYAKARQLAGYAEIARVFGKGSDRVMVEKPAIIWVGAHPNNQARGREGYKLEAVVWHVTEGGMPGPWFNTPTSRVSAHYGVSKTGRIEQYVSLDDRAFAQGVVEVTSDQARPLIRDNWGINPNVWAVSIELEGTTAEVRAGSVPTPEQEAATAQLTAWLFQDVLLTSGATDVAVDREHILMHRDISPRSRTCPVWDEAVHGRMIGTVQALLAGPAEPPDLSIEQRIQDLYDEQVKQAVKRTQLAAVLKQVAAILEGD